jgi:hypothetical protein
MSLLQECFYFFFLITLHTPPIFFHVGPTFSFPIKFCNFYCTQISSFIPTLLTFYQVSSISFFSSLFLPQMPVHLIRILFSFCISSFFLTEKFFKICLLYLSQDKYLFISSDFLNAAFVFHFDISSSIFIKSSFLACVTT